MSGLLNQFGVKVRPGPLHELGGHERLYLIQPNIAKNNIFHLTISLNPTRLINVITHNLLRQFYNAYNKNSEKQSDDGIINTPRLQWIFWKCRNLKNRDFL